MLKVILIAAAVFLAAGIIGLIWFVACAGIENAINQSHSWEENPDAAESEAGT